MKVQSVAKCAAAAAAVLVMTGCNETVEAWKPVGSGNVVRIAVVGDDEFYTEGGTVEAMELAASDLSDKTGTKVEVRFYDDDADYHKAIAYANEIAADPDIAAVVVKQEIDYIDTIADIYEAAEKPFVITNGCYNHTIDKNYQYLLVNFINAKSAGSIMGKYVIENGYKRAAFCHSDTEYEEDELKGFQSELSNSSAVLADTVVGPYTQEQFDMAFARWEMLDIDVVCVSNYFNLNSDVVRMLREKGSDIQVISDYVMDTDEDIALNGVYLDGTVIVPLYSTGRGAAADDVEQRFQSAYGMEMLEREAQSYDVIYMLGSELTSGVTDPLTVVNNIKSEEGYEGLRGTVCFDENGALIPSADDILVFSDGGFRNE